MANRITKYDAAAWLGFIVQQRLIESGEPVISLHERMIGSPDICELEADEADVEEWREVCRSKDDDARGEEWRDGKAAE